MKALTAAYNNDVIAQEEEREKRKQQNFDVRMMMDQVLRKTINTLDKDYQEKAVSISEFNSIIFFIILI